MASSSERVPRFVPLTGLLLALVPILTMLAAWTATPPDRAFMWELQGDQFYYAANARNMIRSGFHLSHANPYDPRADAPRIYSHLFTVLVAAASYVTRLEPLHTYFILRPLLGALLAVSLWYFLGAVFSDVDFRKKVFLFVILTGGLTVHLSAVKGLLELARDPSASFFDRFCAMYSPLEEISGDWLCNIARNYFYTPELLYHSIWFLTLASYLRGRIALAALGVAAELYAHPFTGPSLALVVAVLAVCDIFLGAGRRAKGVLVFAIGIFMAAFGRYIFWLKQDLGHAVIQNTWEHFIAIIPFRHYLPVFGIWLPLGAASAVMLLPKLKSDPAFRCVFVQAAVVFALMNHYLFLPKLIQPAHFSRGYLFTALVVLTFFLLDHLRARFAAALAGTKTILIAALLFLALDNVFYAIFMLTRAGEPPMTLHRDQAGMIGRLAEIQPRQFVASDGDMGQIIPVLTNHRSLLGHRPNTPGYDHAHDLFILWLGAGRRDLFEQYRDISMVCIPKDAAAAILQRDSRFMSEWKLVYDLPEFVLYEKVRSAAP